MRQNRSNHKRRGGIGLGIARRFAEEGADLSCLAKSAACKYRRGGSVFGIGCGEIGRLGICDRRRTYDELIWI